MVGKSMKKFLELRNGQKIPLIGLGTGKIVDSVEIELTIDTAIQAGYRSFDTATGYGNEAGIGKCLKKWIDSGKVSREELYIITKLPLIGMHPERVNQFIDLSLKNLQIDYVDLYLIHWPVGVQYVNEFNLTPRNKDGELLLDINTNLEAIWKCMESLVKFGKTYAIGLSNFNEKQIQRILDVCEITPSILQVEVHVGFQQDKLRKICVQNDIQVCAYAPLGSPGRMSYTNAHKLNIPKLLQNSVVNEMAKFYMKSPAQILIRFLIQSLGVVVIPKSKNPKRIQENIQIFDFELNPEDVQKLRELDQGDKGRSCCPFDGANLHPECPF